MGRLGPFTNRALQSWTSSKHVGNLHIQGDGVWHSEFGDFPSVHFGFIHTLFNIPFFLSLISLDHCILDPFGIESSSILCPIFFSSPIFLPFALFFSFSQPVFGLYSRSKGEFLGDSLGQCLSNAI
jgi:hypothetical protein